MLETLRRLTGRPPRDRAALSTIGAAEYAWCPTSGEKSFPIRPTFKTMTTYADGYSSVEVNVDHDGLTAAAVVHVVDQRILIDISSFHVTEKRRGLATAMVLAIARAVQLAVPTAVKPEEIWLEGYFVNEGVLFSQAVCTEAPGPGRARPLRAEVIKAAQKRLTLVRRPEVVRR